MKHTYDYPSLRAHFVESTRKGDARWRDDLTPDELQALWLVKAQDEKLVQLQLERDRRVDASVGDTRRKLMTIAVNVDLLVKHALGDDLSSRDRDTLAAGRADLADVVTIYTKAAALSARIQSGEDLGDLTREELWNA